MIFFIIAAAVMTMLIVSIHKLAGHFGCELPLSSLVLCGVCAIVINFVIISVTPFLTNSYYYTAGAMILFAAFGTTCYNRYLLHRKIHLAIGGLLSSVETEAEMIIKAGAAGHGARTGPEPQAGTTTATENAIANAMAMAETKAKAAEEAALLKEPVPADDVADAPEEAEPTDNVADMPEKAEPADSVAGAPEEAEQADSVADASREAEQADSVADALEEAEQADSVADAPEKAEPADSVADASEEAKQADNVADVPEGAEPADSAADAPEEVEQADSVADAPEEAEQADSASAVHEEQEPAESADDIREEAASDRALADTLSAMTTMDQLLDFAFEQGMQKQHQVALAAYQAALERYRGDSYAPFIVVSIANIHKELGNYDAAIDSIRSAMDIPAMLENSSIRQQFEDTMSYLVITRSVLQTAGLSTISFKEIPKEYMSKIESIYNSRKSR